MAFSGIVFEDGDEGQSISIRAEQRGEAVGKSALPFLRLVYVPHITSLSVSHFKLLPSNSDSQ